MADSIGIIEAWQKGMLAGDLEAIVDLYEDDAVLVLSSLGVAVKGTDAIRAAWADVLAMGETLAIDIAERDEVVVGDHAYAHQHGTMRVRIGGDEANIAFRATEVMHRGADGTWRYVVDHA